MKTKQAKKTVKPAPSLPPIAPPKVAPDKPRDITIPLSALIFDTMHDRIEEAQDLRKMRNLAESMNEVGLLQPIGICEAPAVDGAPRYRLMYGHRRVQAAKFLKWEQIKALYFKGSDDASVLRARAVENMHREDLNPMESAVGVSNLLDFAAFEAAAELKEEVIDKEAGAVLSQAGLRDAGKIWPIGEIRKYAEILLARPNVKAKAIELVAAQILKPVQWVRDHAFLSRLSGKSRDLVLGNMLPLSYAREIAKVADPDRRDELAERFAAEEAGGRPDLSLDDLRREVSKCLYSLAQVPWKLEIAFKGLPACVDCPSNSANSKGLFDHHTQFAKDRSEGASLSYHSGGSGGTEPGAGVCTKKSCYLEKAATANRAISGSAGKLARLVLNSGKAPKDEQVLATTKAAADVSPPFISASKVLSQAKMKIEDAPHKTPGTNSSSKNVNTNKAKENELKRVADNKHDDACDKYFRKLEPAIMMAVAKRPGAKLLLYALMQTKPVQATEGSEKQRMKAIESPDFKDLLKCLVAANWDSVLKIEKAAGFKYGIFDEWYHVDSGLLEAVARALGLDPDPTPKIETFIEAEKKKAAPPVGKKSKPAKSEPSEDDEEDEL